MRKTAEEMRIGWNNQILRQEWDAILKSEAWKYVSEMVETEALEEAESYQAIAGDTLLARNLARQRGIRWALRQLADATLPPPQPIRVMEEFEHIIPKEDQLT